MLLPCPSRCAGPCVAWRTFLRLERKCIWPTMSSDDEWLSELCRQLPRATGGGGRGSASSFMPPAAARGHAVAPRAEPASAVRCSSPSTQADLASPAEPASALLADPASPAEPASALAGPASPTEPVGPRNAWLDEWVASRRRREQEEAARAAEFQRAQWERRMGRLAKRSPEATRGGRAGNPCPSRCSSRSRSPRRCAALAQLETEGLREVCWDVYTGIAPDASTVLASAECALAAPSNDPAPLFYVGLTRYARRRWHGGDNLSFEESHGSKWRRIYMLATFGIRPGDAEDALINALRVRYGERRCSNVRGGGGGVSPYKPSLLYLCVGRL